MKIQEATIDGFGKLHKQYFSFEEGLNVIYGANEAGKTTLRQFMTAMLYGLEKSRGIAARRDDYGKYLPINGGIYGGSMTVEREGHVFTIQRNLSTTERSTKIYDKATLEEVEEPFITMDKEGFLNTVSMTQNELPTGKEMEGILRNAMANLYSSTDTKTDVRKAIDFLKGKRRQLRKVPEFGQLESLREQMMQIKSVEEKLNQLQIEENRLAEEMEKKPHISLWKRIIKWILRFFGRDISDQKQTELSHQLELIRLEISHVQQQKVKEDTIKTSYDQCYKRCKDIEGDIHQVELAIEAITEATKKVQKTFGQVLNEEVSKIFAKITKGKYTRVVLDDSMELMVEKDGRILSIHFLSNGTVEQLYISLRMAAGQLLYPQEGMPIFFDDAFGSFDDKRMREILEYLQEKRTQVFLFTCKRDMIEQMSRAGVSYNMISLEEE